MAQYNLGCCYAKGTGVDEDVHKALYWLQKAANQKDKEAKAAIEKIHKKLSEKK